MARGAHGPTLAQHVYDQLRGAILRGDHPPGSPLRLADLAAVYDVSMSVVREALLRLVERHLVESVAHVGFHVVDLSATDLADLVEMRVQLEGMALERSIDRGGRAWIDEIVSAHAQLARTPLRVEGAVGATDEWSSAHDRFHDALGRACGSPRLLGLTRMLRDGAEVYRQLAVVSATGARDVAAEHGLLMELAIRRRRDEARAALERHLRRTASELRQAVLRDAHPVQ